MMKKFLLVLSAIALTATGLTPASASHPTWLCVDSGPDNHYPVSNDDIVDVLTITVGGSDDGHPPQSGGCVTSENGNSEGTLIHVEVTGAADPDESDSPGSPDLSCTVPANTNRCSVQPPTSSGGTQTLRAWMDFGVGTQIDRAEGADEGNYPGEMGEPDGTDVSEWTWTQGDPPPAPCGSDDVCWGRVTIEYQARDVQFHGKIERENGSCRTGTVRLWKKRPGRDLMVSEAFVSGARWEVLRERRETGRYYAQLSRTKTSTFYTDWPEYRCAGDRSRVLTVD